MITKAVVASGLLVAVSLLIMAPGPGKPGQPGGPGGGPGKWAKPGEGGPFANFDTNGDKQISMDEWHTGWNKIFTSADANGDKFIDKTEAQAAREKFKDMAGGDQGKGGPMLERFHAMDTNHDGKVSKDEWQGRPAMFSMLDKNGDGAITPDELPSGGPGAGPGGDMAEKIKNMDANGDGLISRSEWKGPPDAFDKIDANHDGNLSKDELAAAKDKMGKGGADADWAAGFDKVDANHDGKISNSEFNDWAHKLFGKLDRNGDNVLSDADRNAGPGPKAGGPKGKPANG